MSAITTLGVDNLSLRGAGTEYNRFSRFFRTRAEAQAAINSGDWSPEAGVANACLTADEGVLYWNADSSVLENADDATRDYINAQIANLVGDAPAVLDQLSELADALGDDANFVTTINDKIDNDVATERARAELAEQTLTTDLATEVTRATDAEAVNAAAIADIQDGYDFTGKITAPATDNVIPFLFADQAAFPAAADVHGAIAHSHADGAIYFAHAGAWHKLANDVDVIANATDLATETNRAVTAEAALDARLDTLEADPTTATAVAAVQADVDQNEADADAADAALSGRLDVLEADPTTATAVAAVQADVDQNEADADAAIAVERGRIDAILSGAAADTDTFAEIVTLINSVDTTNDNAFAGYVASNDAAVAAVQADVDQNEADGDAADAALGVRIDNVESEIDTARTNIYTAIGQTEGATAMGTFTGSTLGDGQTIKQLLQSLETATEGETTARTAIAEFVSNLTRIKNDLRGTYINVGNNIEIRPAAGGRVEIVGDLYLDNNTAIDGAGTTLTSFANINAYDGRLNTLEADPTTATAVAAVQADVDQNEADADAAIALKLDASAVSTFGGTLIDDADAAAARTTLGLGTAATTASTDYATAAQGTTADAALPAAGAQAALSVDHLITLSGVAEAADDLGTFTGATINDNVTVKAALQALETAQEATQADVDQNESDADAAIAAVLAGTSIPGPYNNDTEAANNGVAVGAIYKNSNGTIHWRVS